MHAKKAHGTSAPQKKIRLVPCFRHMFKDSMSCVPRFFYHMLKHSSSCVQSLRLPVGADDGGAGLVRDGSLHPPEVHEKHAAPRAASLDDDVLTIHTGK